MQRNQIVNIATLNSDGSADNSSALRKILAELAALGRPATLDLPDGIYAIGETLEVPVAVSLRLAPGACIRALPAFKGDAVIRKQRGTPGMHLHYGRIAGGTIDGGKQPLIGIHFPYGCRFEISELEIIDCLLKGIYVGDKADTWGYEINIHNVRCAIDEKTASAAGSIGIHYEKITDSYVNSVVIIGYQTGVWSQSSSNDYSQVHVWNMPAHGPLKCNFHCGGWGDSYNQCYADAPFDDGKECYGFHVNSAFNRFTNCRVYCNDFTHDNTVVGFHLAIPGTHGSYLGNFFFTCGPKRRMKAAFAGNLEACTFLGNVYDTNIVGGMLNRIPSNTGNVSRIPPLTINDKPYQSV